MHLNKIYEYNVTTLNYYILKLVFPWIYFLNTRHSNIKKKHRRDMLYSHIALWHVKYIATRATIGSYKLWQFPGNIIIYSNKVIFNYIYMCDYILQIYQTVIFSLRKLTLLISISFGDFLWKMKCDVFFHIEFSKISASYGDIGRKVNKICSILLQIILVWKL